MKNKYFVYDPDTNDFETFATMSEVYDYFDDLKKEYTASNGMVSPEIENVLVGQFTHKAMIGENDSMQEVAFLEQIK